MLSIRCVVFVVFFVLDQSSSLVQLPTVEENDILNAETAIRAITNSLFSLFHLSNVHDRPKIKQYSSVHKYFISLTVQDYDTLKEVAKLTRVDKKTIENVIADCIALLNDILDEYNVIKLQQVLNGEIDGGYDIENELEKIEHLKTTVMEDKKFVDINSQVLKILEEEDTTQQIVYINRTQTTTEVPLLNLDNETVPDSKAFWDPDEVPRSGRRIFGGVRTSVKHFPFIASVQIFNKFQCGGSIISSDLIITAASCLQLAWNNRFYRENPAFLSVRIGSSFYESGGEAIPVLEIYFHPSYDPRRLYNNLAVMRVIRRINFRHKIKKINIDHHASALPMNTDGIAILGWGAKSSSGVLQNAFSNKLACTILDIYPLQECQEIYSKEYVTKNHFCAGFISKGNGACNRDVGGPGVVEGYLVGVISFGSPVCGTPDAPTVFTKVGYYKDWIEEIMQQKVPTAKQRTTLLTTRLTYPSKPFTFYTHWTVTPVPARSEELMDNRPHNIANDIDIKQKQKYKVGRERDNKLFKQFLKTMFESEEIDEYLDKMKETAKTDETIISEYTTTPVSASTVNDPTESFYIPDKITKMNDIEPIMEESEGEEREVNNLDEFLGKITVAPDFLRSTVDKDTSTEEGMPIDMKLNKTNEDANDFENDLEARILQLVADEKTSTPRPTKVSPHLFVDVSTHHKKGFKKDDIEKKIDEAILTLLYLSDGEKKTDNTSISELIHENNYKEDDVPLLEPVTKKGKKFKHVNRSTTNADPTFRGTTPVNGNILIDVLKEILEQQTVPSIDSGETFDSDDISKS